MFCCSERLVCYIKRRKSFFQDLFSRSMTWEYMGLQRVTGGYKGLQGLQEVTRGYKGLQRVTRGYKRLQGVRGVTGGYSWLQGVTTVSYTHLTLPTIYSV